MGSYEGVHFGLAQNKKVLAGLAKNLIRPNQTYVPFHHVYTFTQVRYFRYIHVCHNIILLTVLLFRIISF